MGMWRFWGWKWQEWHITEICGTLLEAFPVEHFCNQVLKLRAVIWKLCSMLWTGLVFCLQKKWSACSKCLPKCVREVLGLFIAAKSVWEQMQCVQSSWGVDVRGKSLWEEGPVLLLEQVPCNWPSKSHGLKWEIPKPWKIFFWNNFTLVGWRQKFWNEI